MAALPLPIQNRPDHGSKEGYTKVREQARVQVAGRKCGQPVHEVFEVTNEHGLSLLPEPSPGDIFFDLEGDPFVDLSGREYLFGFAWEDQTGQQRMTALGDDGGRGTAGVRMVRRFGYEALVGISGDAYLPFHTLRALGSQEAHGQAFNTRG